MKSVYKLLIDIGPLAVFFIFYNKSGLQASILPFMLATVIAVLISYILEKKNSYHADCWGGNRFNIWWFNYLF